MKIRQTCLVITIVFMSGLFFSCTRHEVDIKPVEIKPIHITIDVNVKIDRALDDFFGDIDEAAQKVQPQ